MDEGKRWLEAEDAATYSGARAGKVPGAGFREAAGVHQNAWPGITLAMRRVRNPYAGRKRQQPGESDMTIELKAALS
jgi:hypothetical protein